MLLLLLLHKLASCIPWIPYPCVGASIKNSLPLAPWGQHGHRARYWNNCDYQTSNTHYFFQKKLKKFNLILKNK